MTLTITKFYFDEIAEGRKKIEYRKYIPFYISKFKGKKIDHITFHYRQKVYLDCIIEKIVRIKRPKKLEKSVFITTPECFAIHIKKCWVRIEK